MTRFQILKGEQPKKIDEVPIFDKFVFEKGQKKKIRFLDTELIWKPNWMRHWMPPEGQFFR